MGYKRSATLVIVVVAFEFLFRFYVWCYEFMDVTNTCIVHYYVLIMCWLT
jgi:hypothetical protein